jgi:predicted flap endonuclease-1-like 5' DNA nuclease
MLSQNEKITSYPSLVENRVDDLKKIEGIGPAIEKILNSNNIKSYNDLTNAKVEFLKSILTNAGPLFQNHNPATWSEQAALLRDGKIEEFEKLTKELVAGVRVN